MTQETRIIFELTDIKAVRHQCPKCQGELVHQIGELDPLKDFPKQCPLCRAMWGDYENPLFERYCSFLDALKKITEIPNPAIRLRFEIDWEERELSKK